MRFQVVGLGEVLWDLLPEGPQLGGAPANFACHARQLGASALVATRVGNDDLGRRVFKQFQVLGLPADLVQVDPEAPTGTVAVALSGAGVPEFTFPDNVAWDRLEVASAAEEKVREADAVCFGTLAQRNRVSREAVQRLLARAPARALRVFDVNLRQNFYSPAVVEQSLRLASILKLNESELPILGKMFGLEKDARRQIEQLSGRFGLKAVALTRGAAGSLLYQEGRWSEQPPRAVTVADTVGAGDAFAAALVMGLLNGMDLDEVHALAAEVARYVCSKPGATPALPPQLRDEFRREENS